MRAGYESELYPFGRDEPYEMFFEKQLEDSSLLELLELQVNLEEKIDSLRLEEPARKRNQKSKYIVWLDRNQDYYDQLAAVRDEICKRKTKRVYR